MKIRLSLAAFFGVLSLTFFLTHYVTLASICLILMLLCLSIDIALAVMVD